MCIFLIIFLSKKGKSAHIGKKESRKHLGYKKKAMDSVLKNNVIITQYTSKQKRKERVP